MDVIKSKIQKRPPNVPLKLAAISNKPSHTSIPVNITNQSQNDRKLLRKQIVVSPAAEPIEAKMRLNQKLKDLKNSKIKSCQPTPKMSYKKIPQALHNTEVPLESKIYLNTSMDIENPQLVDNLSGEIFRYMRSIETVYQPRKNYIDFNENLSKG